MHWSNRTIRVPAKFKKKYFLQLAQKKNNIPTTIEELFLLTAFTKEFRVRYIVSRKTDWIFTIIAWALKFWQTRQTLPENAPYFPICYAWFLNSLKPRVKLRFRPCGSNVWLNLRNNKVWPLKWKLMSSSFPDCGAVYYAVRIWSRWF